LPLDNDRVRGDVDGDTDFDANDAFMMHLVNLSGSENQFEQSKGSSPLSATQIRLNVQALGTAADVDGDGDFDANDSFLVQLVKLAGSDNQINQSKGANALTAAQIRDRVTALDGGSGSSASPLPPITRKSLWILPPDSRTVSSLEMNLPQSDFAPDEVLSDDTFREWIELI
jgi:hypothetical protein